MTKKRIKTKPFVFKHFSAYHHHCAHKIGFDGVLLGCWANFDSAKSILDIGTGCGVIALMAAQLNTTAHITGIEIDEPSAKQANENIHASQWKERVTVIHGDVLKHDFTHKFDSIISNPPYFINNLEAPDVSRNKARHVKQDFMHQFIAKSAALLSENGRFSLIYPTEQSGIFDEMLGANGFFIQRKCAVYTRNPAQSVRVLAECVQYDSNTHHTRMNIYDESGNYSAEYVNLTKEFYTLLQ